MADKKPNGKEGGDMSSDSGLGNLPPLSDFDSKGSGGDSGLPPLGGFDSPMSDEGGLPPISDIDVETPQPTGGNIKAAPPGFESKVASTFSSGPRPGGTGFQDLAADSDFSPETPEIGPGPGQDSPMDTPMFDSAFGGGPAAFDSGMRTPAPTQAMETPMFGGSQGPARGAGGGMGFDQGAFGGGMDFGGGTPPPDFSPDTDMQQAAAPVEMKKGKAKKPGGGKMAAVITLVAGLIIGILVGPMALSYLPFDLPVPNPVRDKLLAAQAENKSLNERLQKYIASVGEPGEGKKVSLTKEERDKLEQDILAKKTELADVTTKLDGTNADLSSKQSALTAIEQDINKKTEEFVTAQEQYEDLQNETAIIQARQKGLVAEVDRLTSLVGQLDEANQRSMSVKEAFAHNVDRLIIQIKEGIPLTPEKYSAAKRLASAEDLRDMVSKAKWVTPELQQEYTSLYLKEMEIAASNDYFFAKVVVKDQFGNVVNKWAECLMQGNWGVYFRTFDGRNIGVYENIGAADAPQWVFKEDFTAAVRKDINGRIVAARVPGYEEKIKVLTEKQVAQNEGSTLQQNFDSL
ncbi:MAG TPA: hypothetical protein PLI09_19625 [Candidatus Hydrogenedentes bacterium]|nr:hypothetical protein [Candidatus Hydrogenedentota bacterium]